MKDAALHLENAMNNLVLTIVIRIFYKKSSQIKRTTMPLQWGCVHREKAGSGWRDQWKPAGPRWKQSSGKTGEQGEKSHGVTREEKGVEWGGRNL